MVSELFFPTKSVNCFLTLSTSPEAHILKNSGTVIADYLGLSVV